MAYGNAADAKLRVPVLDDSALSDKLLVSALQAQARKITGMFSRNYAIPVSVSAAALLTFSANVSNTETIIIGTKTYRFMATPAQANDVDIGTDLATTLLNLAAAINQETGYGTYWTGTTPTTINAEASAIPAATTITLTARKAGPSGNYLALDASGCANCTVTTDWTGGLREFDELIQINCELAAVQILEGQVHSNQAGVGNAKLIDAMKERSTEDLEEYASGNSDLIDITGTKYDPDSSMTPLTDTEYPIADTGDPTTWASDPDRRPDRT